MMSVGVQVILLISILFLFYDPFKSFNGSCNTPRKINMEHNNGGLEDHFPF